MIKALKWAYKKGEQHERQRIRTLIAEFKREKPDAPSEGANKWEKEQYMKRHAVYYEVETTLASLIDPYPQYRQEMQLEVPVAPLDRE